MKHLYLAAFASIFLGLTACGQSEVPASSALPAQASEATDGSKMTAQYWVRSPEAEGNCTKDEVFSGQCAFPTNGDYYRIPSGTTKIMGFYINPVTPSGYMGSYQDVLIRWLYSDGTSDTLNKRLTAGAQNWTPAPNGAKRVVGFRFRIMTSYLVGAGSLNLLSQGDAKFKMNYDATP